jgi:hypothetical protein
MGQLAQLTADRALLNAAIARFQGLPRGSEPSTDIFINERSIDASALMLQNLRAIGILRRVIDHMKHNDSAGAAR